MATIPFPDAALMIGPFVAAEIADQDRSISEADLAVVDFGKHIAGWVGLVPIDDVEELVLDEEDSGHVRPSAPVCSLEGWKLEFGKRESGGDVVGNVGSFDGHCR
jgi:hypothetical protein